MTLRPPVLAVLTLSLAVAFGANAQETGTATAPARTPDAAEAPAPEQEPLPLDSHNSRVVRDEFSRLLRESAPELAPLLALEPSLLLNEQFIAGYPAVTKYLAAHPEIRRSPGFYLEQIPVPGDHGSPLDKILEPFVILATMSLVVFSLAWFVRAVVEQKRWSRLSRTQTEVHNKILDRFGSSEELLAYIRTPAGSKFLESAPIPLHSGPVSQVTPAGRVVWSVQIGVVVAAAGAGFLFIAARLAGEAAEGFFALGMIALCVGIGFIASAVVSIFVSKSLGLWKQQVSGEGAGETDVVR